MKKSLITVAVASGLLVSGAAFADDTTVYGLAQFEVGSWGGDMTGIQTADNGDGRLGVKSKEDLGEGMAALAKLEYGLDTTGNTGTALKARETWVGLKTGMGTVELGRIKSAYKYFGGVNYDPYNATLLQARGNGGMTGKVGNGGAFGQNGFLSTSMGYSMAMGAVNFRLTYDPDNGGPVTKPGSATGAKGKTLGFGFNGGNFGVIFAYADDGVTAGGGSTNYKSTKVGGMYNMGGAGKISAQYESSKFDGGTASTTVKTTYLDYQFNIDHSNGVDVALGSMKPDATGAQTEKFSRVAFTHKLSNKTKVWVGYRGTDTGYSLGDVNAPTAAEVAGLAPMTSGKQSVIALGMMKKF